jgi:hypothetical protein
VIFLSFLFIASSGGEGSGPPLPFLVIFPVHLLTMFVILGLTIFYIVDVFRNERVEKDKKVLWAVVLFLGNMIAMPIYWYLYIWKQGPAGSAPSLPLNSADPSKWTSTASADTREPQYVSPREPPNWRE